MLANRVRAGAIEEWPVFEHGKGELVQNIPTVEIIEHVLHLEAQAPEELGPVGVARVGGAVDQETPRSMAVVLQLPFDQVGGVVLP